MTTETRIPTSQKRVLANMLLATASVLFALLVSEFVLYLMDVRPEYGTFHRAWEFQLDREVLYKIKPYSGPTINNLGYRDRDFHRTKSDRTRILFQGDSLIMGYNVLPHETLPKQLEQHLGSSYEVLNMGVYGYGPDQSYYQLLREGLSLDPDVVILGLFPANDYGDLYKNQLCRYRDEDHVEFNPSNLVAKLFPRLRLSLLARKAFTGHYIDEDEELKLAVLLLNDTYTILGSNEENWTDNLVRLMRALLSSFKRELEERQIPFYILIIPSYQNTRNPEWFEQQNYPKESIFLSEELTVEICRELDIPHLNLLPVFLKEADREVWDVEDGHLSAEGNEFVANLLVETLRSTVLKKTRGPDR